MFKIAELKQYTVQQWQTFVPLSPFSRPLLCYLLSDLFELQLQASRDARSQGGAKFSALTGPAWGLPGGDNPQSPKGLRTLPTCLAAS